MLTEVDIARIMAVKTELAGSIASDTEFDLLEDDELIDMMENDLPVSETNGLM